MATPLENFNKLGGEGTQPAALEAERAVLGPYCSRPSSSTTRRRSCTRASSTRTATGPFSRRSCRSRPSAGRSTR
jgi:hypothetical protein